MYDSAKIAETIKKESKSKGIQIKDMLADLDLNKNTLSNMYNGSMLKGDSLARIADYLGCSVDYLLGRSEEKEKPTAPEGDELDELLKDPELHQIYDLMAGLDEGDLDDLLTYCQFLASRKKTTDDQ